MSIEDKIKSQLAQDHVVLYMKGSPAFPQCGFSGKAVYILQQLGAEFKAINVLEDDEIREGIKKLSDWPTIPQLYVDGKFVGGSDIMTEMYKSGELASLLGIEATA